MTGGACLDQAPGEDLDQVLPAGGVVEDQVQLLSSCCGSQSTCYMPLPPAQATPPCPTANVLDIHVSIKLCQKTSSYASYFHETGNAERIQVAVRV